MKKLILCTLLLMAGCGKEDNPVVPDPQTVTDIDGNVYTTVRIGTQLWMTENLKVTKYNDGTPIPIVPDSVAWRKLQTDGYCWYKNDAASNKNVYGALYNWYAVHTGKLAPAGWHVPTDDEWKTLEMSLGMTQAQADSDFWRGTNEGNKLKEAGTLHWLDSEGGNSSGFTALPAGMRSNYDGTFGLIGTDGFWWSVTEGSPTYAWGRSLYFYYAGVRRDEHLKKLGLSVRCVKD